MQRRLQFPSLIYGGNYEALGPEERTQVKDTLDRHVPGKFGSHDLKSRLRLQLHHVRRRLAGEPRTAPTSSARTSSSTRTTRANVANLKNPILFTMTTPPYDVPLPTHHFALFVQDDWRPVSKLTSTPACATTARSARSTRTSTPTASRSRFRSSTRAREGTRTTSDRGSALRTTSGETERRSCAGATGATTTTSGRCRTSTSG